MAHPDGAGFSKKILVEGSAWQGMPTPAVYAAREDDDSPGGNNVDK